MATLKQIIREIRVPGMFLPRVIKAGTYYSNRGKEYWYRTRPKRYPVVVQLENESYKRLIIGFRSKSDQHEAISVVNQLTKQG